jgi:hypothetical protein
MKVAVRWPAAAGAVALVAGFCTVGVRSATAQSALATPHGFISTRYDTHTSSNMYFGMTFGPVTPMVALVSNPRTTYREHLVGVVRFETLSPHLGLTYAVAGAKAIDSWYGQLYVLPSVQVGRLSYDATFELYVPLEQAGVHQLAMNPGNVMLHVDKHLALGTVGVWSSQTGAPYSVGVGPSARLRLPRGSLTLDVPLGVTRWDSEARITFFSSY